MNDKGKTTRAKRLLCETEFTFSSSGLSPCLSLPQKTQLEPLRWNWEGCGWWGWDSPVLPLELVEGPILPLFNWGRGISIIAIWLLSRLPGPAPGVRYKIRKHTLILIWAPFLVVAQKIYRLIIYRYFTVAPFFRRRIFIEVDFSWTILGISMYNCKLEIK